MFKYIISAQSTWLWLSVLQYKHRIFKENKTNYLKKEIGIIVKIISLFQKQNVPWVNQNTHDILLTYGEFHMAFLILPTKG